MTTGQGQGRGRRRRGRRGQRSASDNQRQTSQAERQEVADDRGGDNPSTPGPKPYRQQQAQPRDLNDGETDRGNRDGDTNRTGRQGGDGGRKRSRNRRRNNRRQVFGPMPTEVLKPAVRDVPVTGEMTVRTLDAFSTSDGMEFGCPMLSRTRIGMPFADGRRVPRCSMGWALHNEDEALLCMRTPNQRDCWKVHPEREAELHATDEAEHAAD